MARLFDEGPALDVQSPLPTRTVEPMRYAMKWIRPAALSLTVLALGACDITDPLEGVDLILDIEDAPVEIPASIGSVQVSPGQPTANSGMASNDSDIDRVEELRSIQIEPGFFSFAPATGSLMGANSIAAAQGGSIRIFLFLGGVPIPGTPVVVTVQNAQVTDVQPRRIQLGSATIDQSTIESFLASLPAASRPDLAAWESMTLDEVVEEMNAALASGSIPFAIGVDATGDLDGTLRLSELQFDAQVALSGD